jgi:hypothetical protein
LTNSVLFEVWKTKRCSKLGGRVWWCGAPPDGTHANLNLINWTKCWERMRQSSNWTSRVPSFKLHSVIASPHVSLSSLSLSLSSIYSLSAHIHTYIQNISNLLPPPKTEPSSLLSLKQQKFAKSHEQGVRSIWRLSHSNSTLCVTSVYVRAWDPTTYRNVVLYCFLLLHDNYLHVCFMIIVHFIFRYSIWKRKYVKLISQIEGRTQIDECLRTGCIQEYLNLRGTKWQQNRDNCSMRNFIICNPYQILLGWSNQGWWDGRRM